jgi:predicted dehydrogenase
MGKPYRVGIIGCGFIGIKASDNHALAYLDYEDTELVALCDNNPKKLCFADETMGFTPYTNYMEMVKGEKLDIVSVCTPPETHCKIVCDIAPYVKAIYCEKPIATTLEDADKMIAVCAKKKVILQINHQRLFMRPVFRYSRGLLNTGTHMFSLIAHLFRSNCSFEIQRVDTDEPVFELDCTHNDKPMIKYGVSHLVNCLKTKRMIPVASAQKARDALKMALQFHQMTGFDL